MKKLTLLLLTLWLAVGCNNDEGTVTLPEATTTGAGTFACLVNGKAFIDPSGGYFNCYYQYLNGDYYFGITGIDEDYLYTTTPWSIHIVSQGVELVEGNTYILTNLGEGNATGVAVFSLTTSSYYDPKTDPNYTGELTLTRFGEGLKPNIASGTFWFDVKHPITGETVHITEGRFDTWYSE